MRRKRTSASHSMMLHPSPKKGIMRIQPAFSSECQRSCQCQCQFPNFTVVDFLTQRSPTTHRCQVGIRDALYTNMVGVGLSLRANVEFSWLLFGSFGSLRWTVFIHQVTSSLFPQFQVPNGALCCGSFVDLVVIRPLLRIRSSSSSFRPTAIGARFANAGHSRSSH